MPNDPGTLTIEVGGVELRGEMVLPHDEAGLVVIPEVTHDGQTLGLDHIAERLGEAGLGTLRLQLLTDEEASEDDIDGLDPTPVMLGNRLGSVLDGLDRDDRTSVRPLGLYGAELSAAAALVAAAARPERIGAVVSADGRADLAGDALEQVAAPTLLIVLDEEPDAVDSTREAARRLGAVSQIELVPTTGGSGNSDGLQQIGDLAADWFVTHLVTLESPIDVPDADHPREMRPDRFPPREGRSGRGMSS